jgi:hypothetical protein
LWQGSSMETRKDLKISTWGVEPDVDGVVEMVGGVLVGGVVMLPMGKLPWVPPEPGVGMVAVDVEREEYVPSKESFVRGKGLDVGPVDPGAETSRYPGLVGDG